MRETDLTSVCDCPACPCAVPVKLLYEICSDCRKGRHKDWETGELTQTGRHFGSARQKVDQ